LSFPPKITLNNIVFNLLVAALYLIFAKIGLEFSLESPTITIFWPAGGLALAVLLLGGLKYLPGIFIGGVAAGFLAVDTPWVAIMLGVADVVESYVAYWLSTRWLRINVQLKTKRDFLKLVVVAGVFASAISAFIGPTALLIGHIIPAELYPTVCLRWWMGDVLGIAFITPLILIWSQVPNKFKDKWQILEVLAILGLTILMAFVEFFDLFYSYAYAPQGIAWIILLVIWSALRFGKHITTLMQLIIFTLALWSAGHNIGHYADDMVQSGLFNFWLFGMLSAIGGLMIAAMRDDNEEIQATLKVNEERYGSIFENALTEIFIFDAKTYQFLKVNHGACENIGYSNEELSKLTPIDIKPELSLEQFNALIEPLNTGKKEIIHFETVHQRKNGSLYNVEIHLQLTNFLGKSAFVAVILDITERKHAEDALRIAATAFESQEGMIVTDADNSILRVNKAFTAITGYSSEEAIGENPRILSSGRHDAHFYEEMWQEINTTNYWAGEVWNKRKDGDVYPEKLTITAVKDFAGIVTNYVGTITDITLKKQAEQEIEDLAYYDPLTHLPNRRLMLDRIKHAMAASARSSKEAALLFLDLDHFKTINDTLGHDMGDLLLQQVAERLTGCIREGDTVSRFGGDEYVVLLEGLSEQPIEAAAQAEDIANKILSSINKPYQLASHHYTSSTSIGITVFDDHQFEMEEMLKQADIAMYQAKRDGRNALRFYDPQMQASINERVILERELNQAIAQQQFQLYYQLQVDNSLRSLGAEALIRWNHPKHGLVSPLDFISVSEQNGTITTIGQWTLNAACAQLKVWEQDALTCDLTLSVNVSAKQFHQANFSSYVTMTIKQHAINPARLNLELTESILLDDVEDTVAKMKVLSDIGIQFSLDDFGTGYSSLQYLKRLPLYQLKIDKSFIDDLVTDSNDQAIVRTIIAMAHSLGLSVIAEGVETKEQQQRLLFEGCTHYQGYLYSKPVPIDEFEALLKKG